MTCGKRIEKGGPICPCLLCEAAVITNGCRALAVLQVKDNESNWSKAVLLLNLTLKLPVAGCQVLASF